MYDLGPRALRVYTALRARVEAQPPGARLPAVPRLAADFGVAPLTVRQVLARLEDEGFITRKRGSGTFVRERRAPAVLIVEDDLPFRALLVEYAHRAGYRAVEAADPTAAFTALEADPAIALVLSDVRMPAPDDGVAFIRAVRRRRPALPLAAITGFPEDLAPLHATPEGPVLVLPKPLWAHQIEEVLRLALHAGPGAPTDGGDRDTHSESRETKYTGATAQETPPARDKTTGAHHGTANAA